MDTKARPTTRAVSWLAPRLWLAFGVLAIAAAAATLRPAAAQENLATAEELRELVGPIALYPDDLVAVVLPASTYPLQVVQAARFLENRKSDPSLKPNDDWDDSVVALLNYPEVIELMNDDLDWTYDLGTAVLNQRADVLSAIQDFRDEAYAAGNLRSDERQTITRADDAIEIKPADPQVIYVPYYEPERVVVYQSSPVYYYYPVAYPVYYYPYPAHHHFHTGFFWGVNTWFSIGWHSHYLHVYDPFYYGHPYYGHTYHHPFYVRNVYVNVNRYHYPNYVWEPRYRYGGRPVVRGSEGRVYTTDRTPRRGVLDSNATRTREGSVSRTPAETGASAGTQPRSRGVASSATRARAGTATSPNAGAGAEQRSRGVASSAYRNRAATTTEGTTTAPSSTEQRAAPARPSPQSGAPTSEGRYRSGGGMSQALERSRGAAQPNAQPGSNRSVSPRATEGSTGMPRESSRSGPPLRQQSAPSARQQSAPSPRQQSAPPPRQQSAPPPRQQSAGNDGGARGNSGGGSYRGGGERSAGQTRTR